MATFTGTAASETITPAFVSPTVATFGGSAPSDANDFIDAGGGRDQIDSSGGATTPCWAAGPATQRALVPVTIASSGTATPSATSTATATTSSMAMLVRTRSR